MALKVKKAAKVKKALTELTYRRRPVITHVDEYKGSAYFHFYDQEKFEKADGDQDILRVANVLTFGVAKAKLILAAIDEIKAFVEENDKPAED